MADLGIIFLRRRYPVHWYQSSYIFITGSMPFRYFWATLYRNYFLYVTIRESFKFVYFFNSNICNHFGYIWVFVWVNRDIGRCMFHVWAGCSQNCHIVSGSLGTCGDIDEQANNIRKHISQCRFISTITPSNLVRRCEFRRWLSDIEKTLFVKLAFVKHIWHSQFTIGHVHIIFRWGFVQCSCCGSVDKTWDSHLWGPRFKSPGSGSSALGQSTLSWLPSPTERTYSCWPPACLLISQIK